MGYDKALMEICGQPVIETIIKQLRKEFDDIVVVTNNPGSFTGLDARITGDILKFGPLGVSMRDL